MLVVLDDPFVAHRRAVRVLTRVAASAPLAQEIPALVELDGELVEARLLLLVEPAVAGASVLEFVLGIDELADAGHDLAVVHRREANPGESSRGRSVPFAG